MARNREAAARAAAPPAAEETRLLDEVVAVMSLTAGVFVLLSFVSFHLGAEHRNFAGRVGYELANAVVQSLGLAAYLLPFFLCAIAVLSFRRSVELISVAHALGALAVLLSAAVMAGLLRAERPVTRAGGWIGGFLALQLEQAFGAPGSVLLAVTALVLSVMLLTRVSLRSATRQLGAASRAALGHIRERLRRRPVLPKIEPPAPRRRTNVKKDPPPPEEGPVIVLADELPAAEPPPKRRRSGAVQEELRFGKEEQYQIPPLSFLELPARSGARVDEEVLRKSSQILEAKLADFGIQGKVVEVRPGPVITTFDIEPAPGVKVNRILSLNDDLAMALRVPGVRILAPVPGKAVVGIEVANPRREDVRLRELLESEAFVNSHSSLTLALGKDTGGAAVIGDLVRMPHLLIAGATGSGKSVALNAMIMSILYKAQPRDVRFVMIDMKMLELSVYEDIPHLLVPVVTDPKRAVFVLKNIVEQMDERYATLKKRAVRSLDGYNRVIDRERAEREAGIIELNVLADEGAGETAAPPAEPPLPDRLPKIVVIIDELADLMMTMGRHAEEPITRLAQKARAAGIHLILATQRPSVDVITGLIKANFPARMSFQTTSRVDSRTILDHIGAERLLGGGDMLYMPPGTARLQRLHGPLVQESEILKVVEFIRKQGSPQYAYGLLENPEGDEEDAEVEDELDDELYDQAVRLVTQSRQASISWVQRRLRVGYNRAARMIERMERDGVVSASEGGKPREVLVRGMEEDDE